MTLGLIADFKLIPSEAPPSPYEDLTTYTDLDEDGDFTITVLKCDVSTMRRDATSRVIYDFGAAYFGDFDIDFEFECTNIGQYAAAAVFGMSNSIGDSANLWSGSNDGIQVTHYGNNNNLRIRLLDGNTNDTDDYLGSASNSTIHLYCTITRVGTTCTLTMYSDSLRTVVIDTLVITSVNDQFRYLYVMNSWGDSSTSDAHTWTGYTQNFEIVAAS